jgi:hypothetical protein
MPCRWQRRGGWQRRPGQIERIIDFAQVQGWRTGDNPARLRGHLQHVLPKQPPKRQRTKHHSSLPYAELPAFPAELRDLEGIAPRALEFAILTAARTAEATGAM